MNTSILSNTCIVFLLATASSFGIGPGDNASPFMAGDGNLAIQIHGSTNAVATAPSACLWKSKTGFSNKWPDNALSTLTVCVEILADVAMLNFQYFN